MGWGEGECEKYTEGLKSCWYEVEKRQFSDIFHSLHGIKGFVVINSQLHKSRSDIAKLRKAATRRLQCLVPRSSLSNAVASHAATPSSRACVIDLGKQIWTHFPPNAVSTEAPGA
jgi:hypothetical protein